MWKRNDGSDPVNAVQNHFTAYLAQAVSRHKIIDQFTGSLLPRALRFSAWMI